MLEQRLDRRGVRRQVVHPNHDHRPGTFMQQRRARALATVRRHPVHFAVQPLVQPLIEPGLIAGQVGVGNPDLVEAQFPAPATDVVDQAGG